MTGYYQAGWLLGVAAVRVLARVRVEGKEHIPDTGAFLLLANHQSALDPLCIQTRTRRMVYSMTKSSQFSHPFFRWLLPRLGAFPTRRYKVDPQAVRTTLRLLESGQAVCIYPEGERTWTGRLQRLRVGAVRLALKVGVPIIPCGISGTYRARPRWSGRMRRTDVLVRFGAPIYLGAHDSRRERERALPEASALLERVLRELSGEPVPGSTPAGRVGRARDGVPLQNPGAPGLGEDGRVHGDASVREDASEPEPL